MMGQIMAQAGLMEGRHVSWIPSYGPEMRGGAAYCSVVISDEPIGSPVVYNPDLAVVMNLQSKIKFENLVRPGGHLIINSSLVPEPAVRTDLSVHSAPMNELADRLGHPKVLNLVALGVAYAVMKTMSEDSVFAALKTVFGKKSGLDELMRLNRKAFQAGREGLENRP